MTRAATDPADPDLLITRIQNSRSGSVKKIFLLNLVQKIWAFKICFEFFYIISSLKAVLKLFMEKICSVLKFAKEVSQKLCILDIF